MQPSFLDWIVEQKTDISGKNGESKWSLEFSW